MRSNVNFDFQIGDRIYAAGEYQIESISDLQVFRGKNLEEKREKFSRILGWTPFIVRWFKKGRELPGVRALRFAFYSLSHGWNSNLVMRKKQRIHVVPLSTNYFTSEGPQTESKQKMTRLLGGDEILFGRLSSFQSAQP